MEGCVPGTVLGKGDAEMSGVPVLASCQHNTFLAHAGAGFAELACRGTSGAHITPPRRAGQGRAGLDCERHPARLGFA